MSGILAVRSIMSELVGIDDEGFLGLIDCVGAQLIGLDGTQSIAGPIRIAHIHDFFQLKQLADWQRRLVLEGRVQPFKQAFRELYVVTPAEMASSPNSHRFNARKIRTAVAYRLLQSRGWTFDGGEGDCTGSCRFREYGITAYWHFREVHHFFVEQEFEVSAEIVFRKGDDPVPLNEVPILVFSEVMRAADLVVSVASVDEHYSAEMGMARFAVIQNVLQKLGFNNISVEGNFVYVQGKRASYRIHMISANIHIMPAAYLCVVPDRSAEEGDAIYLPFMDSDSKTAEIISKAIMLSDDDQIKDASIVSQIDAAVGRVA